MENNELISIIIPCYNHANYLSRAVESLLSQTYQNIEIIVVDDGSSDNTKQVANSFPEVKYIYQHNKGLSSARNTGVINSHGQYLLFLDADDWLSIDALKKNYDIISHHPDVAFVSGGHVKINDEGKILETVSEVVNDNHYLHFLQGNYIGMHATVLYSRWVFDQFKYDETLQACEDYDLYMKISRSFPVLHHPDIIAYYRIHGSNMSANRSMMLNMVLTVLERQRPGLKSKAEKEALARGKKIWSEYYFPKPSKHNDRMHIKKRLKQFMPDFLRRRLYNWGLIKHYIPSVGAIQKGDFNRTTPFSKEFGYDRGGPVDRYYIENFLKNNTTVIKGDVLEIGDNEYTLLFGGNKVVKSHILHVDPSNTKATIIGDLTHLPQVTDNTIDCIILTQTLHLIYDFKNALRTCYRILKPGGVLLMTVPGISHIDQGEWGENWLWAFTSASIKKLTAETFPGETQVETFGNVFIATAFLYGMSATEVKKSQLDYNDPHYQVIITAKATKPGL